MKILRLALVAALVTASACSGGSGSNGGPSPKPTNPVAFPLFDGAEVISTHAFHQVVTAKDAGGLNGVLGQGAGTYQGHEVVAGTQAMMPALDKWISGLNAGPPDGWTVAATGSGVDEVRSRTHAMGLDFAVFERTENGKRHGVVVLAVDPQTLDEKAGGVLGMISKFKLLPASLREPIDAQAKKQTGFTVTEMTEPDTPIGAAVSALDDLRNYGGRGVVLIDAVKQ